MPKAPDALLGRMVRVSTHNENRCQSTQWRIIRLDTSADRIWFRNVQTGELNPDPSKLSWFWKQVGDGMLILE